METQIRTTVAELNQDLKSLFQKITSVSIDKKYVMKADNEEQSHLEFVEFKLDHLTQSGRKKLARRIRHTNKKQGYRTFSSFISILKSRDIIKNNIKIELSAKEKAIQLYRKEYVKARTEAETLRLKYVTEKGDFYKS
jgi:hypothetical protein